MIFSIHQGGQIQINTNQGTRKHNIRNKIGSKSKVVFEFDPILSTSNIIEQIDKSILINKLTSTSLSYIANILDILPTLDCSMIFNICG